MPDHPRHIGIGAHRARQLRLADLERMVEQITGKDRGVPAVFEVQRRMARRVALEIVDIRRLGPDLRMIARPSPS